MTITKVQSLLAVTVFVTGCANIRPPVDVSVVPNDCANQTAIINWLEQQSKITPPLMSDKDQYARHRETIRHRIWHLRYTCNPA